MPPVTLYLLRHWLHESIQFVQASVDISVPTLYFNLKNSNISYWMQRSDAAQIQGTKGSNENWGYIPVYDVITVLAKLVLVSTYKQWNMEFLEQLLRKTTACHWEKRRCAGQPECIGRSFLTTSRGSKHGLPPESKEQVSLYWSMLLRKNILLYMWQYTDLELMSAFIADNFFNDARSIRSWYVWQRRLELVWTTSYVCVYWINTSAVNFYQNL